MPPDSSIATSKPSNVLVPRTIASWSDFDLARDYMTRTGRYKAMAGTLAYMAPEQMGKRVTEAADWYASASCCTTH